MHTLLTLLRDFLSAQQTKVDKRTAWKGMSSGDEGYHGAREAFRIADDRCEHTLLLVVPELQTAQINDEIDIVVDALGSSDSAALLKLLSDRGLHMLLNRAPTTLSGVIRKYRRASGAYTAARELSARRRHLDAAEFDAALSTPPAGVDDDSWQRVLLMIKEAEVAVAADSEGFSRREIANEAEYRIETKARERYDQLTTQLVEMFAVMIHAGTFEAEVAHLEPALRRVAYELQRRVPLPELQTKTKVLKSRWGNE